MKNDGKEAELAFINHWELHGHLYRIRDRKDLMGLNRKVKSLADFPKPADFIVSSPRVALHYAEVKSTNHPRFFSFNKIRPAQSAAALREATRGAKSYAFYIFSYALGKWFVMDAMQYRLLTDSGRRSVAFEELNEWKK